jgi:SAM-dependent methyltransferase
MHKEMRFETNDDYWNRRWSGVSSDAVSFSNLDIYPIRYSEMVVSLCPGPILELGCGLGRLVKHYHRQGKTIAGVERSQIAVEKIAKDNPELHICVGDAKALPFRDSQFSVILAFGLFHNIEKRMVEAVHEAMRCLRSGGSFCISMRPDNIEMRLNNWYWRMQHRGKGKERFHKWLVNEGEFSEILKDCGCRLDKVYKARNVSFLWRIPLLRDRKEVSDNESLNRSRGYELNMIGQMLDGLLHRMFPASFCNVLVFIGKKI